MMLPKTPQPSDNPPRPRSGRQLTILLVVACLAALQAVVPLAALGV